MNLRVISVSLEDDDLRCAAASGLSVVNLASVCFTYCPHGLRTFYALTYHPLLTRRMMREWREPDTLSSPTE